MRSRVVPRAGQFASCSVSSLQTQVSSLKTPDSGRVRPTDLQDGADKSVQAESACPTRRAAPHSPRGTVENSPPFQRWETSWSIILPSPGGTTETPSQTAFQPSLRDWMGKSGRAFPPLKCWAIVGCPSRTRTMSISCKSVGCTHSGLARDLGLDFSGGLPL